MLLKTELYQEYLFPVLVEFLYFYVGGDTDMGGVRHWVCHDCGRQHVFRLPTGIFHPDGFVRL